MNTRSIRFRLIGLYASLLAVVVLAFDAYTYKRLQNFLHDVVGNSLEHRTQQIVQAILKDVSTKGESYVTSEIEARYAPALNDKFVRVTRPDGSILYLSGAPNDRSFEPENVPRCPDTKTTASTRQQRLDHGSAMLISSRSSAVAGGKYLVEVGTSLAGSERVLQALLLTLAAGLPILIGVAIFGGYLLMKRALTPVQNIMRAAQDITLHHLGRRLPVSDSGDEIANLSVALNQMIARLDESFQHTNRFTGDASHELRTPLTIIHGELEALLLGRKLDPDLRVELASLLEEVERLVRIVEVFALSRLDTGAAQTESVRLDLAKLAETTAEQMCLLAEEKHIDLVCETREAVEVEGDRPRLKQVVVNLLDNAIKYTPEHGRIFLTVRAQNGTALLAKVADTGPGVSEAALPHLFERFYRSDEVRSREIGGAGLGLSIVHSICTAHGGTVSIKNIPPTGCQVTVGLRKAS